MSRLPPLQPDQMSEEQLRVVAEITSGPRGEVRGPFVPLLYNPAAADAVQRMGSFLRFSGTLPGALREMVILQTARLWTAQYEWFAHHRIALEEGLDPAIADAIAEGREPEFSDDAEACAYAFVQEMYRDHQVSETTFEAARKHLSDAQVVELIVLCGHYNTISMVLNGFEVQIPGGARPLA